MEESIVHKLRHVLSSTIDTEMAVTYVLVETRKLLEKHAHKPFALSLFCNWALHVDLSHERTTKDFLMQVDDFVDSFLSGTKNVRLEFKMLGEFVFWTAFREQFRAFLSVYQLPVDVCTSEEKWHKFIQHYAGVIYIMIIFGSFLPSLGLVGTTKSTQVEGADIVMKSCAGDRFAAGQATWTRSAFN
jgi:hypothetical protein